MKQWFKNHKLSLLILFILIILTYGNSLNNAFLSDDLAEIVQNPNIGKFENIAAHPFGFIRPLLYWIAFHTGGLNPIFFRLINIFFHIGSVLLIYTIFNLLYSKRLAIIVASIFAVHPAISEAVVWISGGMYPQYTFFFLLSFFFYVFAQRKGAGPYLLSSIFYLLSFMSHPQMPLALFLIFPLWELAFGNLKRNWKKLVPFIILSIAYILVALSSLPERTTTLQSTHYQEGGTDNLFILLPIAISSYFELIIFPKTLTLYHSELSFGPVNFAFRILVTVLFLVGILIAFKKNKFIFFWLSFFAVALSPTLTPFRLNWIVAERYLYLPILGILAVVAFGLERLSQLIKFRRAIYIVCILIVALLATRNIIRNIDWKNEDNLWIATGKASPSSPNTHNNLGDVYGRWGDKQRSLQEFQKAIELKPNYGDAYHNLANVYREKGEIDKALENYQNAVKYNPNLWQSYQNIAALHFEAKEYDKSLEYIQKAIGINPKNINLYNNLGIVYLVSEQKDKAKEVFNLVLSADPQNELARAGLIEAEK